MARPPLLRSLALTALIILLHLACSSAQDAPITAINALVRYNGTLAPRAYAYFAFQPNSTTEPIDFHLWVTRGIAYLVVSLTQPYPYFTTDSTRSWNTNQTWVPGYAAEGQPNLNYRLSPADYHSCAARNIPLTSCTYHIAVTQHAHTYTRCPTHKQADKQVGASTQLPPSAPPLSCSFVASRVLCGRCTRSRL